MTIILIAGKSGSGKTFLGEQIVLLGKEKNFKILQTEFSKYLKLYAREIIGYDGSREHKPRKFLQDMGSFIREELKDEHFFTRRLLEDLRIYERFYDTIIISDVRLKKEIEGIKNSQYKVITIKVINDLVKPKMSDAEKNHITELELENYHNFDYEITNKTENELQEFAKQILKEC